MNIPLLPKLPPKPEAEPFEDREGCEFIDGEWVPKHPDAPVEVVHDRKGCEFIDDQWVEKNMSAEADSVGVELLTFLNVYVRSKRLGTVFGPECGYQIFPDRPRRTRKPDVSFVAQGRLGGARPPRGNILVPPDLAVEVNSPSDLAELVNAKVAEYLGAGIRLIWVIYPLTRTAWVFRAGGSANWYSGAAELSGEDVIPGFAVNLESLFETI
jgi:Uma2 family endonuclease